MTELTEQTAQFDRSYREGVPPWVIGEPQPAVVELAAAGAFTGRVLDIGCGAGEHTRLLAGLGYDVLGADASPTALELARGRADAAGMTVRFTQVDALDPAGLGTFDTILDSALFHVFGPDDQARYADALRTLCEPGATLHLLALARPESGPEFGPVIDRSAITDAFDRPGWRVRDIRPGTYRGVVTAPQVEAIGQPAGTVLDVPAWLARIERVAG